MTFGGNTVIDAAGANMARNLVILLLVAFSTSMEMRETIQRMVMVRTTGSDLQPAATGFIYKKITDGPASVVKMGENEVMEQLTKIYEQPKSFTAPIPVSKGPFYRKDEDKLPSYSESKVIPVVETQDGDGHIAGTANNDYEKILSDYVSTYGDDKSGYDDYLKSLGYSDDGTFSKKAGIASVGDEAAHHRTYGDQNKKEFGSQHKYEHDGAADYDSAKFESYVSSGEGDHKKSFNDGYLRDPLDHGYKSVGHKVGNDEGETGNGFHDFFDASEYAKDHNYDDAEAVEYGFHKLGDGHSDDGADAAGVEKAVGDEAGYHATDFRVSSDDVEAAGARGESDDHSAPEDDDTARLGSEQLGTRGAHSSGSSYSYQVLH